MKRKILFIGVLLLSISFLTIWGDFVWAKYPEKAIRFVAPFPPGGGSDMISRALTQYINPYLENRVYVENVTGAAGAIGYREVAKASPDGYTMALMVTNLTIGPHVIKDYPSYEIFDHICILAQDPIAIIVKMDSHFKTAHDVISYAKKHPGKISVGHSGFGGTAHLTIEAFTKEIGITPFISVPFKGTAPSVVAAAGGHVDLTFAGCSESLSLVEGKKLRVLLVFDTKRSRLYPDVPPVKELGYDVFCTMWRGVGVPKGTPKEIKEVLVEAFRKAMENEECKKLIDQMGLERIYLGPEEATQWLKAQSDFFKSVATKIGIKIK